MQIQEHHILNRSQPVFGFQQDWRVHPNAGGPLFIFLVYFFFLFWAFSSFFLFETEKDNSKNNYLPTRFARRGIIIAFILSDLLSTDTFIMKNGRHVWM